MSFADDLKNPNLYRKTGSNSFLKVGTTSESHPKPNRNIVRNVVEEPLELPTMNFGQEDNKQDDGPLELPKWH